MIQFQQQEIEKLAAITGLTPMQVSKLLAMGLINQQEALSAMLVYDWRRLKQRGKYKVAQIFAALSERYDVPKWRVEKAVYFKKKSTQKYCVVCKRPISGREYNRGNGKCDKCVAAEIDF